MTTVAIDFGTSNTVVCIQDPVTNCPVTLKFSHISRTFADINVIPSLVFVQDPELGEFVIGEQVRSQRLGFSQPDRCFQGFKRELAAEFRSPPVQIDQTIFTAEAIATKFIEAIWQKVLVQLQTYQVQPTQVIFTAPVGAFESYLGWFRQLAIKMELPNMQILDESTAAALGYGVIASTGALVLVIDFGGGTLDLSLVRTAKTEQLQPVLKAEVIAKSDAYVGGVDIDQWIAEYFLTKLNITKPQIGAMGWLNLLEIAERMKIQLSNLGQIKESWFDDQNFIAYELSLSQVDLADILESRQLLEQLRQELDEVLEIAYSKGLGKREIQQVLMVGGSCQIKAIQDLIISYFGKSRVKLDQPFAAISYGALALGQYEIVEDYLRHGYALRLWDNFTKSHYYFTIFEKGTRYPSVRSQPIILQVANNTQTEIRLDIGELADTAEIELAYDAQGRMTSSRSQKSTDFRSLVNIQNSRGLFRFKLNPPAEMGMDRLEIKFAVNAQRSLMATVTDLLTQKVLLTDQAIAQLD